MIDLCHCCPLVICNNVCGHCSRQLVWRVWLVSVLLTDSFFSFFLDWVPCLLKWCWWTLWFVRAPARFCWAVPATTWPTTHSFSTISPLLTTSDFPHLLQHAEEPPRYCLLWTFRLTPLLKEVKRVFYIFVSFLASFFVWRWLTFSTFSRF